MQVSSVGNQNFGKIYLFPFLEEKLYSDAAKYTKRGIEEVKKDVATLIRKDSNNCLTRIKQNADGNFTYESSVGSVKFSHSRQANLFRGLVMALDSGESKLYKKFVNKYKNEPYYGIAK